MPACPILRLLKSYPFVLDISKRLAFPRWQLVKSHVKSRKILDVGLGMGTFAKCMLDDGFNVTGIDIDNTSLYNEIKPIIYDGKKIPLKDNSFDNATIICVLHHCSNQIQVLKEVMRVSKKAIIIEDTYRDNLEHILIAIRDSIENWEFYKHEYRTYKDWKSTCESYGWKVRHIKSWSNWDFGIFYGHQTCFTVEK